MLDAVGWVELLRDPTITRETLGLATQPTSAPKRRDHAGTKIHARGPSRRGREIQELGQMGAERRNRHAELYRARGYYRGGAARSQRQGHFARTQFRSIGPARRQD